MPQNFIRADVDQVFVLPPDVREWLPEGELAWTVRDVVESFDLSGFYRARERRVDDGRRGRWGWRRPKPGKPADPFRGPRRPAHRPSDPSRVSATGSICSLRHPHPGQSRRHNWSMSVRANEKGDMLPIAASERTLLVGLGRRRRLAGKSA